MPKAPKSEPATTLVRRLKSAERIRTVYTAQMVESTPDVCFIVEHLDQRKSGGQWVRTWQPYYVEQRFPMTRDDALVFLHEKATKVRQTDQEGRHPNPEIVRKYTLYNLRTRERTVL